MRVVQASFYRDPQRRPAETLLAAWPSLIDVAQGARAAGVDVTVVQAHHTDETITSGGVQVRFTSDPIGPGTRSDSPSMGCQARLKRC